MLKKDKTLILAQPKLGFLYSLKDAFTIWKASFLLGFICDEK